MNRRRVPRWSVLVLALVLGLPARSAELTVFAAASLSDALTEIARRYEAASGDKLRLNFAASSTLARQITEGAPADIFFSADEAKMDGLAQAGLIATDTRRNLLTNTLAVVVPAGAPSSIHQADDLCGAQVRRLALAETRTVPAGIYARAWLERTGRWSRVADRVVPTENVRACLAAVESGNVDAGIVYKSDAVQSTRVQVSFEIPAAETPRILYPVAVLRGARSPAEARALVAFLAGPDGRAVFTRFGFIVLN